MSLKPQIRRLPNHFESFLMKPDHGNLKRPENACIGILELHSIFNFFKYESMLIILVSTRLSNHPPPPKFLQKLHVLSIAFTFKHISSKDRSLFIRFTTTTAKFAVQGVR